MNKITCHYCGRVIPDGILKYNGKNIIIYHTNVKNEIYCDEDDCKFRAKLERDDFVDKAITYSVIILLILCLILYIVVSIK